MRVELKEKKKKLKSGMVPPVPVAQTLEKMRAGISHLNRSITGAPQTVLEMIVGCWLSQAIYVACELDIPGHLKFGPKLIEELADRTNAHPESLFRLLRMLSGHGIFHEDKDGTFAQTNLSDILREDHPESVRGMALYQGGFHWKHWEKLLYSVRTGKTAVEDIEEKSFFEFLSRDKEKSKIFDSAMRNISDIVSPAILKAYDFSRFSTVVDIGGGQGSLLWTILNEYQNAQGILFDREFVISTLNTSGHAEKFPRRLKLVSGDFFMQVPEAADCYILKNIIHDWEDKLALQILENISRVFPIKSRLLLIEAVIPVGNAYHPGKDSDLEMLISVGGKERTRDEYSGLLADAGFRLQNIHRTASPLSIIEAVKIS